LASVRITCRINKRREKNRKRRRRRRIQSIASSSTG